MKTLVMRSFQRQPQREIDVSIEGALGDKGDVFLACVWHEKFKKPPLRAEHREYRIVSAEGTTLSSFTVPEAFFGRMFIPASSTQFSLGCTELLPGSHSRTPVIISFHVKEDYSVSELSLTRFAGDMDCDEQHFEAASRRANAVAFGNSVFRTSTGARLATLPPLPHSASHCWLFKPDGTEAARVSAREDLAEARWRRVFVLERISLVEPVSPTKPALITTHKTTVTGRFTLRAAAYLGDNLLLSTMLPFQDMFLLLSPTAQLLAKNRVCHPSIPMPWLCAYSVSDMSSSLADGGVVVCYDSARRASFTVALKPHTPPLSH